MFYFANIKSPMWTCPHQKKQFREMYTKDTYLIFHAIHFVKPYFAGWYGYVAKDRKFYNFVICKHVGETPTTIYLMLRNFGFSHKIVKDVYIKREVIHSQYLGSFHDYLQQWSSFGKVINYILLGVKL